MIPRVFPQWIDEQKIIDVFHEQRLGRIYKVSIIRVPDSKKRSYPIYQAFIYFSAWYENEIAYHFQQRIFGSKGQARVVYDDPWYWVAFENTKRRLSNNDKRIIRAGYQTYVAEQYMLEQGERIQRIENFLQKLPLVPTTTAQQQSEKSESKQSEEPCLIWGNNPSEEYPMVQLSEIIDNAISHEWVECSGMPWQQIQLANAASDMLGDELRLSETAIDVAESALGGGWY